MEFYRGISARLHKHPPAGLEGLDTFSLPITQMPRKRPVSSRTQAVTLASGWLVRFSIDERQVGKLTLRETT